MNAAGPNPDLGVLVTSLAGYCKHADTSPYPRVWFTLTVQIATWLQSGFR